MTDEQWKEICDKQLDLIKNLQEENSYMLSVILKSNKLVSEEIEQKIEIPTSMKSIGREPWDLRKARLEKAYRKPKYSEIIGADEIENEIPGAAD